MHNIVIFDFVNIPQPHGDILITSPVAQLSAATFLPFQACVCMYCLYFCGQTTKELKRMRDKI